MFKYQDYYIPLYKGHAVSPDWTSATNHKPMGVTWHWTAMRTLKDSRGVLQGGAGGVKSRVSAHYCVGQNFKEGVDRYVRLTDRSWHAGIEQKIRWDGKKSTNTTKGSRACIGIETAHIGYARPGHPAQPGWKDYVDTNCRSIWTIPDWPSEQFEMMVAVGKEILGKWPHIPWQHHHGHHDICPGYKQDVIGMRFADLLRAIYDDNSIPDIWSPLWTTVARQRVLIALGYDLGSWKDDGHWGDFSQAALRDFQKDSDAVVVPYWTTFTCQDAYAALKAKGKDLDTVAKTPA